jgi:catechol 2,3-dioxygenase-like lactoylglutathione lyase family enzyme
MMTPPTLSGLHHVTLPVTDLDGAMTWLETVFGARRLAELDHHDEHGFRFAVVLRLAGVAPLVALRHTQDVTEEVSQWALGVADRAELARWAAHFDGHGVAHSDVMPARAGHVMTCTTPGGLALLLYADEADDAAAGPATS